MRAYRSPSIMPRSGQRGFRPNGLFAFPAREAARSSSAIESGPSQGGTVAMGIMPGYFLVQRNLRVIVFACVGDPLGGGAAPVVLVDEAMQG
jgi:hypothetical protein